MRSKFQQILSERNQKSLGFTIVELLIVVVIIGILAAIVIVAYNGVTQSANASAIADGFKKIEKSMRLYATTEGHSALPLEADMSGGRVTDMIANVSNFNKFLQSPPSVSGVNTTSWRYDNDGDTYGGCSTGAQGVNIYIASFTDGALAQKVDDIMDDGNLACGKIRWESTSNNLLYSMSRNSAL